MARDRTWPDRYSIAIGSRFDITAVAKGLAASRCPKGRACHVCGGVDNWLLADGATIETNGRLHRNQRRRAARPMHRRACARFPVPPVHVSANTAARHRRRDRECRVRRRGGLVPRHTRGLVPGPARRLVRGGVRGPVLARRSCVHRFRRLLRLLGRIERCTRVGSGRRMPGTTRRSISIGSPACGGRPFTCS